MILVEQPGFAPLRIPIELTAGKESNLGTLRLTPGDAQQGAKQP